MEKIWIKEGKFIQLTKEQLEGLTAEQLAEYTSDQAKSIYDEAIKKMEDKIEEARKGNVSKEDFETFKQELKDNLDTVKLDQDEKDKIHKKHADLLEELNKQGLDIKTMKESNTGMTEDQKKDFNKLTRKQQFQFLFEKGMESDDFEKWFKADMKGATPKMDVKTIIGLGSGHTGDIFVTEPVDNIRDIPRMQPHMRDYIAVSPTDETNITFPEVYDYTDIYTLGTQMLAENGEVTDVTFSSKEQTSTVVRLGVSMDVSKRYFRGKSSSIINHVIAQVPDALMFKEDVQVLHGDGAGNNLSGIITDAREFDLTPNTYDAADISSVATYDSGTRSLITFAAAHGLLSGDKIELANTTNYNGTHEDILLIDETKIVINQTYVAETATSWTGTGYSYWYQSVESPQEFDVLSAAASLLEAGLYNANAIFVNPQTTRRIGTLKGSDLHYIGVSRDAAGRLNMDGIPIISIPVIPAGWFLIGDFTAKNIEIRDYTTMSVQFLEDVTTNKTNSVVILADEEIHLVKYNPQWYIYDRFSTAKTQLEKTEEVG